MFEKVSGSIGHCLSNNSLSVNIVANMDYSHSEKLNLEHGFSCREELYSKDVY